MENFCIINHKKRLQKCTLFASCCKQSYPCSRCHDECNNHKLLSEHITHVICLLCNTKQIPSYMCEICNIVFAHYYCNRCKLYSNEEAYHCDECNICLTGEKKNYKHCKKCNCCISNEIYDQHICVINRFNDNCSVCCDKLINFTNIKILNCGHALHETCKNELLKKYSYCPICKATIFES